MGGAYSQQKGWHEQRPGLGKGLFFLYFKSFQGSELVKNLHFMESSTNLGNNESKKPSVSTSLMLFLSHKGLAGILP